MSFRHAPKVAMTRSCFESCNARWRVSPVKMDMEERGEFSGRVVAQGEVVVRALSFSLSLSAEMKMRQRGSSRGVKGLITLRTKKARVDKARGWLRRAVERRLHG